MVPGPRWLEARLFPLASSGSRNPMQSYRKMNYDFSHRCSFGGKIKSHWHSNYASCLLDACSEICVARSEMNISIRSRPCSALDPDLDAWFFGSEPPHRSSEVRVAVRTGACLLWISRSLAGSPRSPGSPSLDVPNIGHARWFWNAASSNRGWITYYR